MASEQMPAEALRMPAQARALGFLMLVPIGDLDGGKRTYRPDWMESVAWSY